MQGMLTRRSLLATATATSAAAAQSNRPSRRPPPNILIILADDLGIGDLSAYGAQDVRTPHIDALLAAGMRFDNFYSNCPVCSPTRASLLTGCYPDRAGVPGVIRTHPENSWGYLAPHHPLLPAVLEPAGYHSAIVGKWHLGLESPNTPTERGFDHFHGFLGDMMDDYLDHRRHGRNYLRLNREEIDPPGHATDLFTGWALDYLDSRRAQTNAAAQPFLLYLAFNAPHTPIQPTPASLARVKQRDPAMPEPRARIVALIEHMDESIGRVLERLRRNGQAGNTLIFFSSDNGGELRAGGTCGPWRGGKQNMFEGGIRVAAGAVWPGEIAPGSRTSTAALTMDLFATACDAAGAKLPSDVDGRSLLPVLRGSVSSLPERDLIWVRREGGPPYQGRDYYAIRRGDWKLLQNTPFEPYQLYNLKDDPGETTDLAKANPKEAQALAAALARHIQRAARTPWQRG